MARTIEVTLYQFDELPTDTAKEYAREWYRRASESDNHFADHVLDGAHEWLTAMGFDVSRKDGFRWSGFWSQGDGASFVGSYRASARKPGMLGMLRDDRPATYTDPSNDITAPCEDNAAWHAFADRLDAIVAAAPTLTASLTVADWHYSHPYTVKLECDDIDGDVFRDLCRDIMAQIYSELQAEYEYQTADEQIDEAMRANEYEFTEDGAPA